MTRAACLLAAFCAALVLAACAPDGDVPYGSIYGGGRPGAVPARLPAAEAATASVGADQQPALRSVEGRDAFGRAVAAAGRGALRDAGLRRQGDRARRAALDENRARLALEEAERARRRAEWQDRRPVGTGPFDRADALRRGALTEAGLARADLGRAAADAGQSRARLDRLLRIDSAQDRLDRMERMQNRQEARKQLQATRSDEDEVVRRNLSYRHRGESADAFRQRVRMAGDAARRQGVPVRDLLRSGPVR